MGGQVSYPARDMPSAVDASMGRPSRRLETAVEQGSLSMSKLLRKLLFVMFCRMNIASASLGRARGACRHGPSNARSSSTATSAFAIDDFGTRLLAR